MKFVKWISSVLGILFLLGYSFFVYESGHYTHIIPKCDYIAVLTGGKGRIKLAINAIKSVNPKAVFISGVYEKTTIGDLLSDQQFSGVYIILGKQARNTAENAAEICDWAQNSNIKSIVLITSDYHIIRTLKEFEGCNKTLNITPVTIPTTSKLQFLTKSFKEYLKVLFIYTKRCSQCF